MAKKIRIEIPGGYYHVTSRGNSRGDIWAPLKTRPIAKQAKEDLIPQLFKQQRRRKLNDLTPFRDALQVFFENPPGATAIGD